MEKDKQWSMKDTEENKDVTEMDNIPGNTKIEQVREGDPASEKVRYDNANDIYKTGPSEERK
jgi:hypothetical protein